MEKQIEEDQKMYLICIDDHLPSFKIEYNIGNGQTETVLVCSKCIQDPAYQDGILSMWCYNCRCEHDVLSLSCNSNHMVNLKL